MSELSGKVALVTGGAGGIGGAVARALYDSGASVITVDRAPAERAADERFFAIQADLTAGVEVSAAVQAAVERFAQLDIVVCAHGGSGRRFGDGPIHECTEEGWDTTLNVNLRSVYSVYHHTVPVLQRGGGGSIVSLSSVLGLVGGDHDFATHAYAAAKGAIISMTRAMAVAYAPDRIRCNVVCPGLIATPMSARAQSTPAILARLNELQPLTGDFGQPEDVANAVLFLAGPSARFVTGSVLTVDGGWTAQ